MHIEKFFEEKTCTFTYLIFDKEHKEAILIDPVMNFEQASGKISYNEVKKYSDYINENGLQLKLIIDTHVHADHMSGSKKLKELFPTAKIVISARVKEVQETFAPLFNMDKESFDESYFDILVEDNQLLEVAGLQVKAIATPGHTPACTCFLVNDQVLFSGDAIFMPDFGTGRCDFPRGSATDLFQSISHKIYSLSDDVKIFVGHDYCPGGRELKWETSVGESKAQNKHITASTSEAEFVEFRTKRDATLNAPGLLLPSLQVNLRGGELPELDSNNTRYLKLPLTIEK